MIYLAPFKVLGKLRTFLQLGPCVDRKMSKTSNDFIAGMADKVLGKLLNSLSVEIKMLKTSNESLCEAQNYDVNEQCCLDTFCGLAAFSGKDEYKVSLY